MTCDSCGRELEHEIEADRILVEPCTNCIGSVEEERADLESKKQEVRQLRKELREEKNCIQREGFQKAAQQVELEKAFTQIFSVMESAGQAAVENRIEDLNLEDPDAGRLRHLD